MQFWTKNIGKALNLYFWVHQYGPLPKRKTFFFCRNNMNFQKLFTLAKYLFTLSYDFFYFVWCLFTKKGSFMLSHLHNIGAKLHWTTGPKLQHTVTKIFKQYDSVIWPVLILADIPLCKFWYVLIIVGKGGCSHPFSVILLSINPRCPHLHRSNRKTKVLNKSCN